MAVRPALAPLSRKLTTSVAVSSIRGRASFAKRVRERHVELAAQLTAEGEPLEPGPLDRLLAAALERLADRHARAVGVAQERAGIEATGEEDTGGEEPPGHRPGWHPEVRDIFEVELDQAGVGAGLGVGGSLFALGATGSDTPRWRYKKMRAVSTHSLSVIRR